MSLVFSSERFDSVITELMPLLSQHYKEIAWKQDKITLNPNFDHYRILEANGVLRMYIAREDGAVVGYAVFFVTQNLHYQDVKQAQSDVFYVEPSRRGAMVGQKLLRDYAESELKLEGVKVITLHIKCDHDWHKLAEYWGYEWTERNMQKWIGD